MGANIRMQIAAMLQAKFYLKRQPAAQLRQCKLLKTAVVCTAVVYIVYLPLFALPWFAVVYEANCEGDANCGSRKLPQFAYKSTLPN